MRLVTWSEDSSSNLHGEVIWERWLKPAAGRDRTTTMKHASVNDSITTALFFLFHAFGGARILENLAWSGAVKTPQYGS